MKFLYVTTVGLTMIFFKNIIKDLTDSGNTVDIACNEDKYKVDDCYREWGCRVFDIRFSRSPLDRSNLGAVKSLKKLVSENHYDIVHCHTPVAGVCARIACRSLRKTGVRVFYTAHGFHFYKGAPLKNWLIYYPVEKLCSRFTDVLITINSEDYALAKKKMKAGRIEYVPGVGVDTEKFRNTVVDRAAKRKELGIPEDAFLLFSVGELNKNKNHQIVIKALAQLNNPDVHYMIAGKGELHDYLLSLANQLGVAKQVHLLGYRDDVAELYKISDIDVFPSLREGLGLAAIEGMAAGLPLVCADNRGTREFAENNKTGFICYGMSDYVTAISKLYSDRGLINLYINNMKDILKKFDISNSTMIMKNIYSGNRE